MQEVQSSKNYNARPPHKFLILGPTGSGKTSNFLTLPGKKFAYLFDPNALLTMQGHDCDYVEFLADKQNLQVHSLSKEKNKNIPKRQMTSTVYEAWEADFNERMESGFFEQYDWLSMDSCTTLLDIIMDRVLSLNGRFGEWPNQDDFGPQMIAFKNIVRAWTSLGKGIYFTGHLESREDKVTKKVSESPMMTGRLRQQIPLLFSDIFSLESDVSSDGKAQYLLNTVNNRMQQFHRTSIRGLNPKEDVTIDWSLALGGQGLGGIVNWWARQKTGG